MRLPDTAHARRPWRIHAIRWKAGESLGRGGPESVRGFCMAAIRPFRHLIVYPPDATGARAGLAGAPGIRCHGTAHGGAGAGHEPGHRRRRAVTHPVYLSRHPELQPRRPT
jgi:hypothetical protein